MQTGNVFATKIRCSKRKLVAIIRRNPCRKWSSEWGQDATASGVRIIVLFTGGQGWRDEELGNVYVRLSFHPLFLSCFAGWLRQPLSLIISLNHLIISANYSPGIFGPALTSVHGLPEGWWMARFSYFRVSVPSFLPSFLSSSFFFFHPLPSLRSLPLKR